MLVTMNGIVAEAGGRQCVLPHPSLSVSRKLTEGSAEHMAFIEDASKPGMELTLRGSVNPSNPYVPAVQPGSKLDWDPQTDPFWSATFQVRDDAAGKRCPSARPSPAN